MKKRFLFLAAVTSSIVAPLFLATNALAQAKNFPSHCQPGEFAHLNAKMGSFDLKTNLIKNGKILSLCADKAKEPFGKFIYRYGAIGNVELEQIATPQDKFFVFSRSLGPRMGEDIIYFTKGEYSFYISEATGMGSGIGLYAFKSGKKILDLFSGNDQDSDFQANGLVNPEKASSPVFARRAPKDKF
jgi:hypothetical protein